MTTLTNPNQEQILMNDEALPMPAQIVGDWLRREAALDPNREFVQCGSPWMTLGELDQRSDRLAAALQGLGVEPGDRVAVNLPNRIEYIVLIYAIAKAGAIQVPLNTYLRGDFLRHQLAQTSPKVYFGDASALLMLQSILDEIESIEHLVVVGEAPDGDRFWGDVTYADLEETDGIPAAVEIKSDDVCAIIYTSGTTGPSKGCSITHGYYCNLVQVFIDFGWYQQGDVVFGANPLFHFSGQTWLVAAALAVRGSVIVEPAFSASTYMARIRETGATAAMGMGAMGMAIMAQPPSAQDAEHSLRHITFMPSSADFVEKFASRFGIEPFAEVFGQSECWPALLGDPRGERRPGSMGKPTPGLEVRLVDENDVEVAPGEPGEIVLRGTVCDRLFSGYWNDAEATVKTFRNLWHHTGDSGRVDEDGFYWFVDRKKDSLRRRGENVSSLELEAAIMKCPGVAAVAIHAVPSDLSEDEIKACIVTDGVDQIGTAELFEFFKKNLPYFAVPRYIEFLSELPSNVNGRVQKFKLRERGITPTTIDLESLGMVMTRAERRAT